MDENEARRILGVGVDDAQEQIKAAYRKQLKEWHPDRFAGDAVQTADAALQTRRILAAYRSLAGVASPPPRSSGQTGPEPFEESLWNQWNPFHPSHDRYGPNTAWDRVAIALVVIVGVVLLVLYGLLKAKYHTQP